MVKTFHARCGLTTVTLAKSSSASSLSFAYAYLYISTRRWYSRASEPGAFIWLSMATTYNRMGPLLGAGELSSRDPSGSHASEGSRHLEK